VNRPVSTPRVWAAMTVALAVGLAGAGGAQAASKIVYADTTEEFGSAIYTTGANGKGDRRIRSGGQDEDPAWGPRQRNIAYVHYNKLFVMRANGKRARRISNLQASTPAWSPNGKRIAFTAVHQLGELGVDEHYELAVYTVRPSGRRLRRLTRFYPSGDVGLNPDWSPSGRSIVYDNGGTIIRMRSARGGHKRVITRNGNDPSWSPSGKRLAFVRSNRIYVSRIDGSHARLVSPCEAFGAFGVPTDEHFAQPVRRAKDCFEFDADPTWGLNGRRIAYSSEADPAEGSAIFSIKPNRRGLRVVTTAGESLDW
jgi:Tol biopolymer transport system component